MAKQGLLANRPLFMPFALIYFSFFLPETQTCCLEAQEPCCVMRTKATWTDGETEARSLLMDALFEHTAVATDSFPLDFLNWKKNQPGLLKALLGSFLVICSHLYF